jgi:hypothetical protein
VKNTSTVALAIIIALTVTGCSPATDNVPEPTDTSVPSENPSADSLTPPMENSFTEMQQRSIADTNSLNEVVNLSVAEAYSKGFAQTESNAGVLSTTVFDPKREKNKRALMWFEGDDAPLYAPVPEEMITAYSGNGGLFRLDFLKIEIEAITNILTYDLPSQDSIPSAAEYEYIKEDNSYKFISPALGVPVTINLNSAGLIESIVEELEDGNYTYSFKYNTSEYQKYFDDLYKN